MLCKISALNAKIRNNPVDGAVLIAKRFTSAVRTDSFLSGTKCSKVFNRQWNLVGIQHDLDCSSRFTTDFDVKKALWPLPSRWEESILASNVLFS